MHTQAGHDSLHGGDDMASAGIALFLVEISACLVILHGLCFDLHMMCDKN